MDDKRQIYPLLLDHDTFAEITKYSLVKVRGRWLARNKKPFLVTERITVLDHFKNGGEFWPIVHFRSRLVCFACRTPLTDDRWDLNDMLRPECEECAKLRGDVDPVTFLRIYRRLARKRSSKTV